MTPGPLRGAAEHPGPPDDPAELASFPGRTVQGRWFRSHVDRPAEPDHGCWWFASLGHGDPNGFGRFDLAAPEGTCYLGSSAEVAARERVGPFLSNVAGREYVSAAVLATADGPVAVTEVSVAPVEAANLPVKAATRWVNRSLSVGTGIYGVSQAWAARLRAASFDAITYEPRYTGGRRARALALFGPAGTPDPRPRTGVTRRLGEVLLDIGVDVVAPRPPTAAHLLAPEAPPPVL
jgi:hypothetical protein